MSIDHPAGSPLTRREFTLSAIAAALTAACTPARGGAPAPAAPAPAGGTTGAAAAQPDPNAPLADALMTVVVAQYGRHLPEDERPRVREGILRNLRIGTRLRGAPIANSADPFSVCVNATEEVR